MVTIGDEGFGPLTGGDDSYPYTTDAGGTVWADTLDIATLDFATFHLYPDSCKLKCPERSSGTRARAQG